MDIQTDSLYTKLREIGQVMPMPSFVKEAYVLDQNSVPDNMFASPERRMYSIADPASTYLSTAYFSHYGNKLASAENTRIANSLLKAAEFYGITPDVSQFLDKSASFKDAKRSAAKQATYAIPEKKAYPIANPDQLLRAVEHFTKHAQALPVPERRIVAKFIVKKADEFGVPLTEEHIITMANNDATHLQKTAFHIATRVHSTQDPRLQRTYMQLAKELPQGGAQPTEQMLTKLASVLEHLDAVSGLNRHYGGAMLSPMATVFNLSEKQAAALNKSLQAINVAGASFPMERVASLPMAFWGEAMGDDFAKEVFDKNSRPHLNKLAEIIDTLPRGDKQTLRRYLENELGSQWPSTEVEGL